MLNLKKTAKQYYNETEAARALHISLEALHEILDEHVFNHGQQRPVPLEFTHAELLLLSVWAQPEPSGKLLPMPSRN